MDAPLPFLTREQAEDVYPSEVESQDLHERHQEFLRDRATCLTCGEEYPGTVEHGIRFNCESWMYENVDTAHSGNWIIESEED